MKYTKIEECGKIKRRFQAYKELDRHQHKWEITTLQLYRFHANNTTMNCHIMYNRDILQKFQPASANGMKEIPQTSPLI